jgi:signal peptidase I
MPQHSDHRPGWCKAIIIFLLPICLVGFARWMFIEPFVIPSGSMLPGLRVHDHVFVDKTAYGLQNPLFKRVLWQWVQPQRFDVIVFRYPENLKVFYIKRVIGLAGERIELRHGDVLVDGVFVAPLKPKNPGSSGAGFFLESNHQVRYINRDQANFPETTVPKGHLFVLGDNRDQSNDSRFWGFVPTHQVLGRAWLRWLACEQTLSSAKFLCDPMAISWDRVFTKVR